MNLLKIIILNILALITLATSSSAENLSPQENIDYLINSRNIFEFKANDGDFKSTRQVIKKDSLHCQENYCYFRNPREVLIIVDFQKDKYFVINQVRDYDVQFILKQSIFFKRKGRSSNNWVTIDLSTNLPRFSNLSFFRYESTPNKVEICDQNILVLNIDGNDEEYDIQRRSTLIRYQKRNRYQYLDYQKCQEVEVTVF